MKLNGCGLNIYNRNKRRPAWQSDYLERLFLREEEENLRHYIRKLSEQDLFNKVLDVIEVAP